MPANTDPNTQKLIAPPDAATVTAPPPVPSPAPAPAVQPAVQPAAPPAAQPAAQPAAAPIAPNPYQAQNPTPVNPVTGAFDESKSAAARVNSIINEDSPLMQTAARKAQEQANMRGLRNSTMAIQAGQQAVIETATPLALSDSGASATQDLANQAVRNKSQEFNSTLMEQARQSKADVASRETIAKLDADTRVQVQNLQGKYQTAIAGDANIKSTWDAAMQQIALIQNNPEISGTRGPNQEPSPKEQQIQNIMNGFGSYAKFWSSRTGGDVTELLKFGIQPVLPAEAVKPGGADGNNGKGDAPAPDPAAGPTTTSGGSAGGVGGGEGGSSAPAGGNIGTGVSNSVAGAVGSVAGPVGTLGAVAVNSAINASANTPSQADQAVADAMSQADTTNSTPAATAAAVAAAQSAAQQGLTQGQINAAVNNSLAAAQSAQNDANTLADAQAQSQDNEGGSGGGKVLCTAMNDLYGLPYTENRIWIAYAAKHLTPAHQRGYHRLFLPVVKYAFKSGNSLPKRAVRAFMMWGTRYRTWDLANEMAGRNPQPIRRILLRRPLEWAVAQFGKERSHG